MKTVARALKMLCVFCCVGAGTALAQGSVAKTAPVSAQQQAAAASKQLENAMLEKMISAPKLSGVQRATSLVQIYQAFSKGRFRAEDEALVYLSMAVLHSYERSLRYAALPLVRSAIIRRPTLTGEKNILPIWKIFVSNFATRSPRDEVTLAGIAALFDGPVMMNSDDSRFAYFRGASRFAVGNYAESMASLAKVGVDTFDYRKAKFTEGANLAASGKLADALAAFQIVVSLDLTEAENAANVDKEETSLLRERAVLQSARLLYEMGRFDESLAYYRTLRQESPLFYESLAEQSWAFFMAGFPNRAMGAAYAAQSPFFADMFNPDVRFLDAVLSYWLCDFVAANVKIEKFLAHTRNEGDALRGLVLRYGNYGELEQLDRFARIAEDASKGVSPKNIGLGPKVLGTLLRQAGVGDYLADLETLRSERADFKTDKRYPGGKDRLDFALGEFEKTMRAAIGAQVKNRLKTMAKVMDQTLMRTRLLHLEVLTATKDVLVGKGRTVQGNEFASQEQDFSDVGQNVLRNWVQDKNEYWYDELGHYVFREQSKCSTGAR